MTPEHDDKTKAAVEAYLAQREQQRAEGQRIAREALDRREGRISPEQGDSGQVGEYAPPSKESVTKIILDQLEAIEDPEEREQRAIAMIGQEAGHGNWDAVEAALIHVRDPESKERVYNQLRARAQEQNNMERAQKYASSYEDTVKQREILSRLKREEENEKGDDANPPEIPEIKEVQELRSSDSQSQIETERLWWKDPRFWLDPRPAAYAVAGASLATAATLMGVPPATLGGVSAYGRASIENSLRGLKTPGKIVGYSLLGVLLASLWCIEKGGTWLAKKFAPHTFPWVRAYIDKMLKWGEKGREKK